MVQKSDALFVTKASLCFVPAPAPLLLALPPEGAGWQPVISNESSSVQTKIENSRIEFSGRIGFLGT
jgi:hypothetical protein